MDSDGRRSWVNDDVLHTLICRDSIGSDRFCAELTDAKSASGATMPRFFFDLDSSERFFPDEKGSELSDVQSACEEALIVLPDIFRVMWAGSEQNALVSRVRDASGQIVFDVKLSLMFPTEADDSVVDEMS